MEIVAKLNYLRISPRKTRLVVDLLRGMEVERAKTQLAFSTKRVSVPILKLLNSAIANAKNNFSKSGEGLYIKKIYVDQGPTYKRFRPRARGVVGRINKRTSHISIILDERRPMQTERRPRRRILRNSASSQRKSAVT